MGTISANIIEYTCDFTVCHLENSFGWEQMLAAMTAAGVSKCRCFAPPHCAAHAGLLCHARATGSLIHAVCKNWIENFKKVRGGLRPRALKAAAAGARGGL